MHRIDCVHSWRGRRRGFGRFCRRFLGSVAGAGRGAPVGACPGWRGCDLVGGAMANFALSCRDDEQLAQQRLAVKQMSCPVCGLVGALILHGPLRGCCGCSRWGRVRGHRRAGCGRTFSMALPEGASRASSDVAPQLGALLASLRRGEGLARAGRGEARQPPTRARTRPKPPTFAHKERGQTNLSTPKTYDRQFGHDYDQNSVRNM